MKRIVVRSWVAIAVAVLTSFTSASRAAEPGLVGHWKLQGDCRDYSGNGNHGINHGVVLETGEFDGAGAYIDVTSNESLKLGMGDFTFCARIYAEEQLDD